LQAVYYLFLKWCAEYPAYREMVKSNPVKNKVAREILGKPEKKNDALQHEQFPAWFTTVRQTGNPVISTCLDACY